MVMRNRHEGPGSPGWGDDLPPKVRARFGNRTADLPDWDDPPAARRTEPAPAAAPAPLGRVREYSRLALLFLAVGLANVVVLLLALAFLDGRPGPAFLMPGR